MKLSENQNRIFSESLGIVNTVLNVSIVTIVVVVCFHIYNFMSLLFGGWKRIHQGLEVFLDRNILNST